MYHLVQIPNCVTSKDIVLTTSGKPIYVNSQIVIVLQMLKVLDSIDIEPLRRTVTKVICFTRLNAEGIFYSVNDEDF